MFEFLSRHVMETFVYTDWIPWLVLRLHTSLANETSCYSPSRANKLDATFHKQINCFSLVLWCFEQKLSHTFLKDAGTRLPTELMHILYIPTYIKTHIHNPHMHTHVLTHTHTHSGLLGSVYEMWANSFHSHAPHHHRHSKDNFKWKVEQRKLTDGVGKRWTR